MKSSRLVPCLALASFSILLPALASAQEAAADLTAKGDPNVNAQRPELPAVSAHSPAGVFGDKGQVAISSDAALSISSKSISGVSGSTTNITLLPAVDYFVANNVSVGGFIQLNYTATDGHHDTTFGIGPRVGYNVAFSERFSFWPKLGLSYTNTTLSLPTATPDVRVSQSDSHLALNIFAPVVFHPVQHFFVGFGPALDTDLSGDRKTTTIAGHLTLGGWL